MRWRGGGRGGGEWIERSHRGWLEDTALCSLQREAPLRGAPAPWMTGQRELITSKRPSQVELFISLSLIGCKNLRAILHNLSEKFQYFGLFQNFSFQISNSFFSIQNLKKCSLLTFYAQKNKTYDKNVYFFDKKHGLTPLQNFHFLDFVRASLFRSKKHSFLSKISKNIPFWVSLLKKNI